MPWPSVYDFTQYLNSGGILSGAIGSGQIGQAHIASGAITGNALGSGAIKSGQIASGQLGPRHLGNDSVWSGHVGSGQIASGHIHSSFTAAIGGGGLTSGSVTSGFLGDFAVIGGLGKGIRSGSINSLDLTSGIAVNYAQYAGGLPADLPNNSWKVPPYFDGTTQLLLTSETISGTRAVQVDPSGYLRIAMHNTAARMPAVGISLTNALSGQTCGWAQVGSLQFTSGMNDFSGYLGKKIYVGQSGHIITISGTYGSGGIAVPGSFWQPLGTVVNSGGIVFNVYPAAWQSGPGVAGAIATALPF